jgi:sec-independent protein translocase protein TatA
VGSDEAVRATSVDMTIRMFRGILQPTHLIILLIVALLFLGPKRLPEAGRGLGQGLKEFKSSMTGSHGDDPQIAAAPDVTHEDNSPLR